MQLTRFTAPGGRPSFGVVLDGVVTALHDRLPSFEALLAEPASGTPWPADPRWSLADVVLEPPIGSHAKILCVGFNYATHARETGTELPRHPTLFTRYPDSLVGAGTPILRPPEADSLDWEGEVALVIGAPARRVSISSAAEHIAGFTCLTDNSVREWQQHTSQATAGKNWAGSGSCGPWLVTPDETAEHLELTTRVNRDVVQHDSTANLVFSFAELIAYISTFTPLRPGDVIATGTPSGVGFRREPPRYLQHGDELEVQVSRVGVLRNTVLDDSRVAVGAG